MSKIPNVKHADTAVNRFLDKVKEDHGLDTDADLCRALDVFPPVITKTRSGVLPIGPNLLLRLHEKLGIPVAKMRKALAE